MATYYFRHDEQENIPVIRVFFFSTRRILINTYHISGAPVGLYYYYGINNERGNS